MTEKIAILNSDHPIDPDVRRQIDATLTRVALDHQVRILFACESGSRGWGFASPDSDYDVRFIYAHPVDWYLTVFPGRDVIELPISDVFDVSGWDLRKALGLLRNGNATLIEWLSSPVVYCADDGFVAALRAAAEQVDRPERAYYHYLHMARKNHRTHLRGTTIRLKKYLYVLRPLLACLWLEQQRGPVPMRFQSMVDALIDDTSLTHAIAELLAIKRRAMESELAAPMPVINQFIELHLDRIAHLPGFGKSPLPDFGVLDTLLRDTLLIGFNQPALSPARPAT